MRLLSALKLTMKAELALNSQRSAYFCFPSARIKNIHHNACSAGFFFFYEPQHVWTDGDWTSGEVVFPGSSPVTRKAL